MREVAPSILAADKNNILKEIELADSSLATFLHIDIMDGIFVENKTWDSSFVLEIHDKHHMINDVHIMVEKPWIKGKEFASAGADIVTFHLEACPDEEKVLETIKAIKENGSRVGISIKPNTPVDSLKPYLDMVDLILIMSVEPGKGGQKFIPSSIEKIKRIKELRGDKSFLIEVDGGINEETYSPCYDAGADILVAGSYLFGHEDMLDRIAKMKGEEL